MVKLRLITNIGDIDRARLSLGDELKLLDGDWISVKQDVAADLLKNKWALNEEDGKAEDKRAAAAEAALAKANEEKKAK